MTRCRPSDEGLRTRRTRRLPLGAAALALCTAALTSCRTQVWPGPMPPVVDPLPGGLETVEEGLDEVIVTRLSDPVRVRPAGSVGSIPLPYVDKRRRLRGGSTVHLAAGGRVEVAWPGEGLLVQLFDAGHLRVGVRERGEPAAILYRPTRAVAELPGGTRLRIEDACEIVAPDGGRVGPLRLERTLGGILRLFNNGATAAQLDFGDERLVLGPSQSIDLAEIDAIAGRARAARRTLASQLPLGDGTVLRWSGPVTFGARADSVWMAAGAEPASLDAGGSLWHLEPGSGVQFGTDPSLPLVPSADGTAPADSTPADSTPGDTSPGEPDSAPGS